MAPEGSPTKKANPCNGLSVAKPERTFMSRRKRPKIEAVTFDPSQQSPEAIADKRAFANRWLFSVRHVDSLLAQGLPHLKIGKRRVRIVIAEGDAWMKATFAVRRRGPVRLSTEAA
jgi:hypothetical protein